MLKFQSTKKVGGLEENVEMGVVDQPLIDEVRMVRLSFGEGFEIFQLDLPSPS